MKEEIARLHIRALPNTWNSRLGVRYVGWLYGVVGKLGYIKIVKRENKIIGVVSGIGKWILTLAVLPEWQRQGIGKELLRMIPGRRLVYTSGSSVGFYEKMGFQKIFKLGKTIFLWRK